MSRALGSLHIIYRLAIYVCARSGARSPRAVGKINIEFRQDAAKRLFNLMVRDEFEMFLFRRDANPKITTPLVLFPPSGSPCRGKSKMHRCRRRRSVITRTLSCVGCAAYLRNLLFKFTRNFIVAETRALS